MAGDLEFRSLDLQNGGSQNPYASTIWFDIHNPYEPAEVRGEDIVIPAKPGQTWMPKVKHRRLIEIRGVVRGIGADAEERSQSWAAATEALMDVMDFTLAPGTLRYYAPYLGLLSGSRSILATAVDAIPGPVNSRMSFQRWTIRLLAIGDPPEWEEAS